MDDLKALAEELGIKIDGRWSDERIQQEIDKALGAPAKPEPFGGKGDHDGDGKAGGSVKAEKMVPVRVKRDYWIGEPGNAQRIRKGTVVEVPIEAALDGLESGILERVK